MQELSRATKGVIPIVPTPFDGDGSVSTACFERLVDYYERCGVDGLTILGVMGEAGKLSHEETALSIDGFLKQARERLPVIVGVSGPSLSASMELARYAADAGAAGVMLQPMPNLKSDDEVVQFFAAFIEGTNEKIPVCVQDYPTASGVHVSLAAWRRLAAFDAVFMLKHEPPAGLQKLSRIREAEREGKTRRVSILTSNNALHLPQELDRGADGAMAGVAFSDLLVRICALHRDGMRERAFDLHDALLPLIRHESQGQFGLAVRKEILRRRGALRTGFVRYPGCALDAVDQAELDLLMARLARRLEELGEPDRFRDARPISKARAAGAEPAAARSPRSARTVF